MIKSLWLYMIIFLVISCATSPDNSLQGGGGEGVASTLPTPNLAKSNFSPYFSTIDNAILLNIQNGSPDSIQRAISSLRSDYEGSSEQAAVLLAISSAILDYAWPSKNHSPISNYSLPTNVYTSTLESINRGIYEGSFDSEDYFSLTLPSLVLFSNEELTSYYEDAKSSLETSLVLDDSSVLTLYLIGTLEMRMGNYETAQRHPEKAMSLDEGNIDIVYAYFELLINSGAADEAYRFGQGLMQKYPTNSKILGLTAEAAFDIDDFTTAESLIAQSLQFEPDNISLLLFRAKVLFELGDYLDVSSLLDVYSRTNVQNKDYLLLRAKLQSTWNKNTTSAIRTIQDALSSYPDDDEILLLAASLASQTGQRISGKSALDFISAIIENDPQNLQAREILVSESISRKNWNEAYSASTIIMSNERAGLNAALQHVEICIALGFLEEARRTINTYYSADSNDENLQQWYIRLLIAEGLYSDASTLIEQMLQGASGRLKSVLFFERSRLQSSDSRILADLRASLTANPRNEDALFGLYTYYFDRFDYSKAQYYLKQVIALSPSNVDAIELNAELDILLQ